MYRQLCYHGSIRRHNLYMDTGYRPQLYYSSLGYSHSIFNNRLYCYRHYIGLFFYINGNSYC